MHGTRALTPDRSHGQDLQWRGTIARLGDAEARFVSSSPVRQHRSTTGEGVVESRFQAASQESSSTQGVANVRLNGDTAIITGNIPSLARLSARPWFRVSHSPTTAVIVMNRIDLSGRDPCWSRPHSRQRHGESERNRKGELRGLESRALINLQDSQPPCPVFPSAWRCPRGCRGTGRLSPSTRWMSRSVTASCTPSGRLGEGGIETAKWASTFTGELGDL